MAWLVRDGEVLAALEVATSRRDRWQGLLGRDGIAGGLLLRPARAVHTFGMRFPIDVAFCAEHLSRRTEATSGCEGTEVLVLDTVTMKRNRLSFPRLRAGCVIEAEAGAFDRWRLHPGDCLEIKG